MEDTLMNNWEKELMLERIFKFYFFLFCGSYIQKRLKTMASDKEIIMAMRENQERGFRLLMASYKEPVYWHIRRLVVSHDDAQDAAQESFVHIFRNFGQYSEENSFKAWIFRIATNEALRLLGRQKNATMLSLDDVTAAEACAHKPPQERPPFKTSPPVMRSLLMHGTPAAARVVGVLRRHAQRLARLPERRLPRGEGRQVDGFCYSLSVII